MAQKSDGFKFPDLSPAHRGGRFLSVREDSKTVYLSKSFVEALEIAHGDRAVVAYDDDQRPWVGFVRMQALESAGVDASEIGPPVFLKSGNGQSIQSVPFHLRLKRFADGEDRVRLYLTGEVRQVQRHGVTMTLHRVAPDA